MRAASSISRWRGTSATLLARKWESAILVNVDNETLRRIMNNQAAMDAVMNIEGFRALGSEIFETVVNKSDAVKQAKKERGEDLTPKEKRELTAEEKEYKSKRKQIQEKTGQVRHSHSGVHVPHRLP